MLVLAAILPPHALLLQTSRHAHRRHRACAMLIDTPAAVLTRCALQRDLPAEDVLRTLEELERAQCTEPAAVADFDGRWELVWSSAATKLPLLNGYMPNRELLSWDLQAKQLRLEIETLPFLPKISIVGEGLAFDEAAQTLTYAIKDKPPSQWRLLYVDRVAGVMAARSSVTGLNVIKRVSAAAEAAAPPAASARSPAVVMAAAVEDPRACMGTWYVQQQVPALAFLEAGARNGVEQYEWDASLAEAGGGFSVTYSFNRAGAAEDEVTTVRQRGWVAGGEQGAGWRVAPVLLGGFCPPVRLPFIILDVEPSAHLVCTGGAGSWMYVMTRERRPAAGVVEALLDKLAASGVDVSKLMPMEHTGTS